MIKVDNGRIEVKGKMADILADLTVAMKNIRESFAEDIGEKASKELVERAYELSLLTDEEVNEETQKSKEEVRDLLMSLIFGKGDKGDE